MDIEVAMYLVSKNVKENGMVRKGGKKLWNEKAYELCVGIRVACPEQNRSRSMQKNPQSSWATWKVSKAIRDIYVGMKS